MKALMPLAIAAAVLIASSAPAQRYRDSDSIREREYRLEDSIKRNVEEGRLNRRDADRALDELQNIRRDEERLRDRNRGELSSRDYDRIRDRLADLDRDVDRMREASIQREGSSGTSTERQLDPGQALNRLLGTGPDRR